MEQQLLRRVQISGLSIIAFLGLVGHMLMFVSGLPMQIGLGIDIGPKVDEILGHMGGSIDGMYWMLFVFFVLSILPAFIPLIMNARWGRWTTFVLALVMALMNIADGLTHIFKEGEIPQGLSTLVISGIAGGFAAVYAFAWARDK